MLVVIEGALDSELDELERRFAPEQEVELGGGWRARVSSAPGGEVALLNTGVGVANAAAATALACAALRPDAVISQGTAGAHDISLHSGDVVLGREIVRLGAYQSARAEQGISPLDWQPLEVSGEPQELRSSARLLDMAREAASARGFNALGAPRAVEGRVGSGDVWNCESDMIAHLNGTRGTSCEEMETYAAARMCARFGVEFLSVRAISNNERLGEEYEPATALKSQQIAGDVAIRLLGNA